MSKFVWPSVKEAQAASAAEAEKRALTEDQKNANEKATDAKEIRDAAANVLGDKAGEEIAAKVAEEIRKLGLDKIDRRHLMFPGAETAQRKSALNVRNILDGSTPVKHWDAERTADVDAGLRAFFHKVLLNKPIASSLEDRGLVDDIVVRTLSSSDSEGGYLIPPGYIPYLTADLPKIAKLLPLVTTFPTGGAPSGEMPTVATNATVAWGSENTAIGAGDPVFGTATYAVNRMNVFCDMPRELVNDTNPRIVDTIIGLFRQAMADELDRCIAYGNGSGKPTGIYQATTITDVSGVTSLSSTSAAGYLNLIKIMHSVDQRYHSDPSCRWVFNQNVLAMIESILDGQNQPVFRPGIGEMPSTVLGKPFVVHNGLPNTFIGFGALRYYYLFDHGDMGMESTTTGGDSFKKHQVLIKFWQRLDGKYVSPAHKPFARSKILANVTALGTYPES
jgi:HK97 family phage major capsid protein